MLAHVPSCVCATCKPDMTARQRKTAMDKMAKQWQTDAAEAGKLHKQTSANLWKTAYLVARSVKPSKGGRPSKGGQAETVTEGTVTRVSMREFAERAGLSPMTVQRYYATWQSAAVKELVPPADKLDYYPEPKALSRLGTEEWDQFYPKRVTSGNDHSDTKASGARAPSVSARDRSPQAESSVPAMPTASREPNDTRDDSPSGASEEAVEGIVIPPQHPVRESTGDMSESVQARNALAEFKLLNEGLGLLAEVSDDVLLTVINDDVVSGFMGSAAGLAARVRKIRKAASHQS